MLIIPCQNYTQTHTLTRNIFSKPAKPVSSWTTKGQWERNKSNLEQMTSNSCNIFYSYILIWVLV